MNPDATRLVRHLILAVLIKLALLTALWWLFVRDHAMPVDAGQAAAHLASTAGTAPAATAAQGTSR